MPLNPFNFHNLNLRCCLFALLIYSFQTAYSQSLKITGNLADKKDNAPMIGVGVVLVNSADTLKKLSTATDIDGNFTFRNLEAGTYKLSTIYLGYNPVRQYLVLFNEDLNTGSLKMEESTILLKDVNIQGTQIRTEQKGDTTQYNANAFKTNKDASVQDLVAKMPGITVENGVVKAQGENVQKVYIDGKEFFGDDANIALRNLPAEVVDKIQVFDRLSDQAQFTGFNDGNTQKSINIVTKRGMSNGQFGKAFAGYGTFGRYQGGGNINLFKGDRRISIIGLTNNINQQNFSSQDLLGISSSSGQQGGGGGGGGGGFGGGGGGTGGGQGGANNFLTAQQTGINSTNSIGLNYSDKWGKKTNITGSYFFNNSNNETQNVKERIYFLTNGSNQYYNETSNSNTKNYNHRFSTRMEYNLDSNNSFILNPRLSVQSNDANSTLTGVNTLAKDSTLSKIRTINTSQIAGYDFTNDLMYRHKFNKKGRTLSVNINSNFNNKNGTSGLNSTNQFFNINDSTSVINQNASSASGGYSLSPTINYTEPFGKKGILQLTFNPTYNKNNSEKATNNYDSTTESYTLPNTVLSNNFKNTVITQQGGLSYRFRSEKLNFMAGVNYQNVSLVSDEISPVSQHVPKTFNQPLPIAFLNYRFSKSKSLRINYRTSTSTPSITQLQNLINNTNPLQLSTGNPDLKQQYTHTIVTRYNSTSTEKGRTLVGFLSASYISNYITNATMIAREPIVLQQGVTLNKGSQLSKPVNVEGYLNVNSYLTYGFPVAFIKSNLNLNGGLSYIRTPGLINNVKNYSNAYTMNSGITIGSNISEKIDFTISYSAYYNIVKNSIQSKSNNNYFYHLANFKLNWMPWKGLVITSELTETFYYFNPGNLFNRDIFLWNPSIAYKFLKKNAAEIRLSSFDLLNQNNSISRTVAANYVENNQTNVLHRYFMVTFTYTFRNFTDSAPKN